MTSLGLKPFESFEAAMLYARFTTIAQIVSDLGVAQECHIYVTEEGVEAIAPVRDAEPANAVDFICSFSPRVSG